MQTWKWLYKPSVPFNWRFAFNVVIKALVLFVIANIVFALLDPLPLLGRVSIYNLLVGGRERLPYGENPRGSYNLSLYQLEAMFASHTLAQTKEDGYRVLVIGDSSVWGILLKPEDTLVGQINQNSYRTDSNELIRAYNLGYPTMSLTKDLMLLDHALKYDPDLIVWLFTLESFDHQGQLDSAIVKNNADEIRDLIQRYGLNQDLDDERFVQASDWDQTIIGQRRALADLLRLQLYGVTWALTGIDQEYPNDYKLRAVDLQEDETWHGLTENEFSAADLSFDVLEAGVRMAGDTPVLLINEPMFISQGKNSDIRYNFFYPRWTYDAYRTLLLEQAGMHNWNLIDLWDALPAVECYTDSPVHLTPDCSAQLGEQVGKAILRVANGQEMEAESQLNFS